MGTDYWFSYDSMNRMTIANGQLVGGAVSAATKGVAITYDVAGRRRSATEEVWMIGYADVWVEDPRPAAGTPCPPTRTPATRPPAIPRPGGATIWEPGARNMNIAPTAI